MSQMSSPVVSSYQRHLLLSSNVQFKVPMGIDGAVGLGSGVVGGCPVGRAEVGETVHVSGTKAMSSSATTASSITEESILFSINI